MKKKSASTKAPGQRQLRVGERIRHILSDVMRDGGFHDPDLASAHNITITSVDIGPDLQHAIVYVMPLGGKNLEKVVAALNRASGYLRSAIAAELELRYTPKLFFKVDHSFEQVDYVERLLRQDAVQKDLNKKEIDDEDTDQ